MAAAKRGIFAMCDRCIEFDIKVGHYREIAAKIIEQVTLERINKLIADLQAQKVALHPGEGS